VEGGQERGEKSAQKIGGAVQEAEELPEIEASGGEQGVRAVAGAALQPVASQQPSFLAWPMIGSTTARRLILSY
jgi:hypothetical protein